MCYKTNTKVLARADFNTNTKCVLLHKGKKLLAKRWRIAAEILAMYLRPRHRPTSFSRGFAKFATRGHLLLLTNVRPTCPSRFTPWIIPKARTFHSRDTPHTRRCKFRVFVLFMRFFPSLLDP